MLTRAINHNAPIVLLQVTW